MQPIYIILYAVIVTLLLTLASARLRRARLAARRFFWVAITIVGVALLVAAALSITR